MSLRCGLFGEGTGQAAVASIRVPVEFAFSLTCETRSFWGLAGPPGGGGGGGGGRGGAQDVLVVDADGDEAP